MVRRSRLALLASGIAGLLLVASACVSLGGLSGDTPPTEAGPETATLEEAGSDASDGGTDGDSGKKTAYLVVLGGSTSAKNTDSVISAEIMADGSLGPWKVLRPLPKAVVQVGAFALDDAIVVVNGQLSIVTKAQPNQTLTPWAALPVLPDNRDTSTAVTSNGFVYVAGGITGFGYPMSVYGAGITPTGLSPWTATTSLLASDSGTGARSLHGSVATGGFIYLFGGMIENSTWLDSVLVSKVGAGGQLGAWVATTPMPHAAYCPNVVVSHDWIFILGTIGGDRSVYATKPGTDGMLGAWQQTTTLDVDNSYNCFGHAAYKDWVYVMGGSSGTSYSTEVVFARAATDGTVGAWLHTTPLPEGRSEIATVVVETP